MLYDTIRQSHKSHLIGIYSPVRVYEDDCLHSVMRGIWVILLGLLQLNTQSL